MIEQLLDPDCRVEDRNGQAVLVSQRFGDIYFSAEDGLEETRLVFLDGNRLGERMAERGRDQRFTIAETGFGTGLNFLAVLALWQGLGEDAPALQYCATEIAPLDAELIRAALVAYPELAPLVDALIAVLPPRWPGRHRRLMMDGRVTLDLLYGDSSTRLREGQFRADAWLLDGFAPSRNPGMWDDELFDLIARNSAPGATLASFTAAGHVRRGLEQAGFSISRHDGFGSKRHRITGALSSAETAAPAQTASEAVVIGAGIAGAATAFALRRHGITPLVLGRGQAAADGASGNIAAVQSPRLTALDTFPGRLSLTAWGYARYLAERCEAVLDRGSMIYAHSDRETQRQAKIADQGWPEELLRLVSADDASRYAGIATGLGGTHYPLGGSVDPRRFVTRLLAGIDQRFDVTIEAIEKAETGWRLIHRDGAIETPQLVVAAGAGLASLSQSYLPPELFQVTAGQVSHLPAGTLDLRAGLSFGGYMARADDGQVALGASFDWHEPGAPIPLVDDAAHARNRALLPEAAAAQLPADTADWQGRASLRLAVPDRHPLAGRLDEGLYILAGLGARGMVTAPILGEHVASLMVNAASPLDIGMASVVDPLRFTRR